MPNSRLSPGGSMAGMFRRRPASDAVALRDLEKAANLVALAHVFPPETHPYPDQVVLDRWREVLAEPGHDHSGRRGRRRATAFAAFDPTTLLHLGVRPDHWGTGLAAAAMDAVPRRASGAWRRTTGRGGSTNAWAGGSPAPRRRRPSSPFPLLLEYERPRPSWDRPRSDRLEVVLVRPAPHLRAESGAGDVGGAEVDAAPDPCVDDLVHGRRQPGEACAPRPGSGPRPG